MVDEYRYDFSVIVLCYNPDIEKLQKTIISIINQTDISFEIIICDDGSSFNYKSIITNFVNTINFKKIDVKYIFSTVNMGTVRNYLNGVNAATGKYVKVISPGDYLYDSLSLLEYKKHFNEDIDLFYSDCVFYSDNKIVKKDLPLTTKIFDVYKIKKEYFIKRNYFVGATICIKRDKIEYILNIISKISKYSEDYPTMTIALLEGFKILPIEKNLIWYESNTGISNKNSNMWHKIVEDMNNIDRYLINNYSDPILHKYEKILKCKKHNKFIRFFEYIYIYPEKYLSFFEKFLYKPKKTNDKMIDLISITRLRSYDNNGI